MKTDVVIVGGGMAGLSCAWELAEHGLTSAIVEKASFLGGQTGRYSCKATNSCQRCGACALEDMYRKVCSSDRVRTLVSTTVGRVERTLGQFNVELVCKSPHVSTELCNGCGVCRGVCPAVGAIERSPFCNAVSIVEDHCLFFRDGSCAACVTACPEHAITLSKQDSTILAQARAVVIAAGFKPFNPLEKPRLGYGRVAGVLTATELDELLRDDKPLPAVNGSPARTIAFIQCVGSRDVRMGRNYCSRVCCGYALRMVRLLRGRFPWVEPSMFYMDIQTFERDFDRRLAEASQEARLVRAIPSEIRSGSDGRPELIYEGPDDRRTVESYDLVVLSVGISPTGDNAVLGELFGIGLNTDGFLGHNGQSVCTESEGVFVAGTVQGPRSIRESVWHSVRTAAEAAAYLRGVAEGGEQ